MNTVKIIHTADLHLDCKFTGLPVEKSKIRRQELKDSFSDALKTYADADIVLISGDIFDNSSFSKSSVLFLKKVFSDYPEKYFFISMGNHDPYNSRAYEMLKSSVPDNVVIFSDKAEYIELDNLAVRVYGISFSDKYEYDSLMDKFEVIDDNYINILVIHGDLTSGAGKSKYNPLTEDKIASSGFDYIALGHIHNFDGIHYAGKTYYAYSGALEPHGFDECGEKGVIYGTVGKGMCRLSLKNTSLRNYCVIDIDVTDASCNDDILSAIKSAANDTDSLYRINLNGFIDDGVSLDTDFFESVIDAFYIKIYDNTHHRYNLELLSDETGLKGYIAKNVLKELRMCRDCDVENICAASDYLFELIDNGE